MTESFGNFDLVKKFKMDFTNVVISTWKSRLTGLTVIHLDYEGIVVLSCYLGINAIQFFSVKSTNYRGLFCGCQRVSNQRILYFIPFTWLSKAFDDTGCPHTLEQ